MRIASRGDGLADEVCVTGKRVPRRRGRDPSPRTPRVGLEKGGLRFPLCTAKRAPADFSRFMLLQRLVCSTGIPSGQRPASSRTELPIMENDGSRLPTHRQVFMPTSKSLQHEDLYFVLLCLRSTLFVQPAANILTADEA